MTGAFEELVERLSARRAQSLGGLSHEALEELRVQVRKEPRQFLDDAADEAFYELYLALGRFDVARHEEEGLDNEAFLVARSAHREKMIADCEKVLSIDPDCLDAALIRALLLDDDTNKLLARLESLMEHDDVQALITTTAHAGANAQDLWSDVFSRPYLRLIAAYARTLFEAAAFTRARHYAELLLELAPFDELGTRHTLALIYARQEDEEALELLDKRFGRAGNAWMHLARMLLLYKLDRMEAAARALQGYIATCKGGAYVLLRPFYIDSYVPDRPSFEAGSFEETVLALHEADPLLMDTPDYVAWASEQPRVMELAERYAEEQGFDW